jgi:hypothetical protein
VFDETNDGLPVLTGAELAGWRQWLGLTTAQLAGQLGIKDEKRLREWFRGWDQRGRVIAVPDGVAEDVVELVAEQEQDVAALVESALAGDGVIRIPRKGDRDGMPAEWWMAAAVRARRQQPELRIEWATEPGE